MRKIARSSLGVLAGSIAVVGTVTAASAAIVCNDSGDCWHTTAKYTYKPEFHVTVHPDDWKWGANDHYRWREHGGRGYWHGDKWEGF